MDYKLNIDELNTPTKPGDKEKTCRVGIAAQQEYGKKTYEQTADDIHGQCSPRKANSTSQRKKTTYGIATYGTQASSKKDAAHREKRAVHFF